MLSMKPTRARTGLRRFAFLCLAVCCYAQLSAFGQGSAGSPPSASTSDSLMILQAFYQGDENCPSVAIVKAAIATFGYPGVYAAAPVDDGQRTKFLLRDGSSIEIADTDLEHGKTAAKFVSNYPAANKQIADQAATLYALMISRMVALSKPDNAFRGIKLLAQAELLLSGNMLDAEGHPRTVAASDLPVLLGLKSTPLTYRAPLAYVHTNGFHAAFATGKVFDQEGTPTRLWKFDLRHGKINHPHLTLNNSDFMLSQ